MSVDLHSALYTWVRTVTAITAIIGTPPRFYPVSAMQSEALPFAVYEEDQHEQPDTQDAGASVLPSTVRIACIAIDVLGARALCEAFKTALTPPAPGAPFTGAMGAVNVQRVLFKGASPAYQWAEQQFAVDASFKFWYSIS